jgi:hypothetical protein
MVADGVDVTLEEWPGAVHAFTALPLSEGRSYRLRYRAFVHEALPLVRSEPADAASPGPSHVPDPLLVAESARTAATTVSPASRPKKR